MIVFLFIFLREISFLAKVIKHCMLIKPLLRYGKQFLGQMDQSDWMIFCRNFTVRNSVLHVKGYRSNFADGGRRWRTFTKQGSVPRSFLYGPSAATTSRHHSPVLTALGLVSKR